MFNHMSCCLRRSSGTIIRCYQFSRYCYRALSTVPFYQVDSFSNKPFRGNPAAVCLLTRTSSSQDINSVTNQWPLSDETMLKIASENNLSETAFVIPANSTTSNISAFAEDTHFLLRWFTPTKEVNLCGHATLATAAVLLQKCGNKNPSLHFATLSGELIASPIAGSSAIEMDLPLNTPVTIVKPSRSMNEISQLILGAQHKDKLAQILYNAATKKLVLLLNENTAGRTFLENLTVSPTALLSIDQSDLKTDNITGVIVTVKGAETQDDNQQFDFLSRYFAPWNGITEDPVTGSAHTVITPMWAQRSLTGQTQFKARQCSQRGGVLALRVDTRKGRLFIGGDACVVIEGVIHTQ